MILDAYHNSLKYFFYSISFSIILIILFALYDLVIVKDFFNNIQINNGELKRVSGLFGDELIMGSVLKTFLQFLLFFSIILIFLKKIYQLFIYNFYFMGRLFHNFNIRRKSFNIQFYNILYTDRSYFK